MAGKAEHRNEHFIEYYLSGKDILPNNISFVALRIPFAINLTSGEVSARIHRQHEKYGTPSVNDTDLDPVLRLVDIQLIKAIQNAWGGNNAKHVSWDKEQALINSERYWLKVDNMVSMKRAKDALKMRRIMVKPFARKFLQDQEEIFKEGTIKFLDRVENLRQTQDGKVDIYAEFGNYAFDVLTEIVYGGYFKKAAHPARYKFHTAYRTGIVLVHVLDGR